jgi:exodeoxyribonuclease VII large subunit
MPQDLLPTLPGETVFTVSQANAYLKEALDSDPVLADITITGEVSGYRRPASGHHYFALRDANSTVRCVMFTPGRGANYLADGAQVLARGRISLYPARGELQLYTSSVRPVGLGALQAAFEELKRKLEAEGLFDQSRKRPLPRFPQRIAVITSPTGAVIQDIINVLRRRYPLGEVVIVATPVQGETAVAGIVSAFAAVNAAPGIDAAILARGGGSLEDLWPFNDEAVARAIFACRVPLVSAIGHETDFTIADFVADVRAPTPSAAAELVTPDWRELARQVKTHAQSLSATLDAQVREARMALEMARDRLGGRAPELDVPRRRIEELLRSAGLAASRLIEGKAAALRTARTALNALGPSQILERGYAIVRITDGPVLRRAADTKPGDPLTVMLADGTVHAETKSVTAGP